MYIAAPSVAVVNFEESTKSVNEGDAVEICVVADGTYVFTLQVYVTVVANGGTAGMHNMKYKAIHSLYLQLEALILHQNLNLELTLEQEIPGHVTQYLLLVITTLNLMKPSYCK